MRGSSERLRREPACVGAVGCAGGARDGLWHCGARAGPGGQLGPLGRRSDPLDFFPPALSPAVGTGKKLPFAGNFEVVVDFLGGVGSGREGEEEEE